MTSAGKLAGSSRRRIVNYPEVAILGIGRIAERPVVRDGAVAVRAGRERSRSRSTTGSIDGARAAEFGLAVIQRLERA